MKVALLTNMIPPYRVSFFRELADRVDLRVIADTGVEGNRDWGLNTSSLGFDCKILPKSGIKYKKKRLDLGYIEDRYLHLSGAAIPELDAFKPEVIISGEMGMRTIRAIRYGQKYDIPVVIWSEGTAHTEAGEKKVKMAIRRYLCKRAAGFFSNGKDSSDYLMFLGADEELIQEGMTGVATQQYLEQSEKLLLNRHQIRKGFGLSDQVLIFVGSLSQRKGVEPYLRALEQAIKNGAKDFSLLFVGEGEERFRIEAFAEKNPMIPVHITGFVDPKDIFPYYAAADLFVMPTVLDNWPLVTIEALSSCLPQLFSCYNGASADLCQSEVFGRIIDPLNVEAFTKVLNEVLTNPLARLDKTEAERVANYYSPINQAKRASLALKFFVGNHSNTKFA